MPSARVIALCLTAALTACGGGGSDSAPTPTPPPPAPAMPTISATVLSINGDARSSVRVQVSDPGAINFTPIPSAVVTANGTPVPYVVADQAFEADVGLTAGSQVTLTVTLGGTVLTRTVPLFAAPPVVTDPVPGQVWDTFNPVTLRWTSTTSRSTAGYQLGVTDDKGALIWPANKALKLVGITATSQVLQGGDVTYGNRVAVIGLTESFDWPGATSQSAVAVGSFTLTPFTAITHDYSIVDLSFKQYMTAVEIGKSVLIPVQAERSTDFVYEDVSALATWTSLDPSKVTVSATGVLTGVSRGRATIRANYKGRTADISVFAFATPPLSPAPPLNHSVSSQGDYGHSGFVTFGGATQTFPPTATWTAALDAAPSFPVVAEGKVFVTTRAGSLYALDLATGAVAWGPVKFSVVGAGGPAYDQGNIFVANSDSEVRSFVAATGAPRWAVTLSTTSSTYVAPTAVNGIVYVSGTYNTYALDARDGEMLWARSVYGVAPTVGSDGIYVLTACEGAKLTPYQGTPLWQFRICSSGIGRGLALGPDGLFNPNIQDSSIGTAENIFDPATGVRHAGFASGVAPALHPNGLAYVQQYPKLAATSPRPGATPAWTFSGDGTLVTKPFLVDSTVFVGGTSGMVYALDAATGAVKWSTNAGAPLSYTDELAAPPLTGFGAGEGWVLVPAGSTLKAWKIGGP